MRTKKCPLLEMSPNMSPRGQRGHRGHCVRTDSSAAPMLIRTKVGASLIKQRSHSGVTAKEERRKNLHFGNYA